MLSEQVLWVLILCVVFIVKVLKRVFTIELGIARETRRGVTGLKVHDSLSKLLRDSDAVVVFVADNEALLSVVGAINEEYSGLRFPANGT